VPRRAKLGGEGPRRALLHLLPGGAAECEVGGDEADDFGRAVLGGEPLQQGVRVRHVAHGERPELDVRPYAVPDEDASGAVQRDEARERVGQLAPVGEVGLAQDVVAVEEIEGRLSHSRT
jgi:hypothetical protein